MDTEREKRRASQVDGNLPTLVVDDEDDEELAPATSYRAVNLLAVLSAVFGLLSVLTMFSWYLAVLPLTGISLAILAVRQIRRAKEVMAGLWLARGGVIASLGLWAFGAWFLAFYASEVPTGYIPVTFDMLQPDRDKPSELVPPRANELNDQYIYIKGYIYPGRQITGLKSFILVPTRGHCQFCTRQLQPTEMIFAKMMGDLTADFSNEMTGIGGKLKVTPTSEMGKPTYEMEVNYLR
jgi:hypothetical protein